MIISDLVRDIIKQTDARDVNPRYILSVRFKWEGTKFRVSPATFEKWRRHRADQLTDIEFQIDAELLADDLATELAVIREEVRFRVFN